MDRANELGAFIRTVERGSFSAAARDMGQTPSAVSKLVARLETRLGTRLLNRSTRELSLTAEGEVYFRRGQLVLQELAELEDEVAGSASEPRGLLRVNCGVAFGLHLLSRQLPEFLARYPAINLDLSLTDRVVDLVHDGFDVAIRTAPLGDSSLVARKIVDAHRMICAAPSYLAARGHPKHPEELLQHSCIAISEAPDLRRWPFRDGNGGIRIVEVACRVLANNAESVLQLGVHGGGIIRLADIVVGRFIADGRLVPLLEDVHVVEPLPVYAVMPARRSLSRRAAVFVDFLVEKFAHAPWRQPR